MEMRKEAGAYKVYHNGEFIGICVKDTLAGLYKMELPNGVIIRATTQTGFKRMVEKAMREA
jgi:hypothetical protein